MVEVITQLDLDSIYQYYGPMGAPPYAPKVLLGLLFYGYATGVFKIGIISLDGSKFHAEASKSNTVSYKWLLKLEAQWSQEVKEVLAMSEQTEQIELPEGFVV